MEGARVYVCIYTGRYEYGMEWCNVDIWFSFRYTIPRVSDRLYKCARGCGNVTQKQKRDNSVLHLAYTPSVTTHRSGRWKCIRLHSDPLPGACGAGSRSISFPWRMPPQKLKWWYAGRFDAIFQSIVTSGRNGEENRKLVLQYVRARWAQISAQTNLTRHWTLVLCPFPGLDRSSVSRTCAIMTEISTTTRSHYISISCVTRHVRIGKVRYTSRPFDKVRKKLRSEPN